MAKPRRVTRAGPGEQRAFVVSGGGRWPRRIPGESESSSSSSWRWGPARPAPCSSRGGRGAGGAPHPAGLEALPRCPQVTSSHPCCPQGQREGPRGESLPAGPAGGAQCPPRAHPVPTPRVPLGGRMECSPQAPKIQRCWRSGARGTIPGLLGGVRIRSGMVAPGPVTSPLPRVPASILGLSSGATCALICPFPGDFCRWDRGHGELAVPKGHQDPPKSLTPPRIPLLPVPTGKQTHLNRE